MTDLRGFGDNSMALEALIFDVDGTLADTERDGHRVACNPAFVEAGLAWRGGAAVEGARPRAVRRAIPPPPPPDNVTARLRHAVSPEAESWFEVIGAGDVVAAK